MARYIDADALISSVKNELWDWNTLDGIKATTVLRQTITDIQNMPTADVVEKEKYNSLLENSLIISEALNKYQTADVVEVVRCKDCVHRYGDYCHRFHDGYSAFIRENDFCSYGEMKDNESVE